MSEFDFGCGSVPAHRHEKGGGWVADSARVDASCWIGPDARVYGNALVDGNASISSNVDIFIAENVGEWLDSFTAFSCADGKVRIVHGCRRFTISEAKKHWKGRKDRKRTYALVLFIERLFKTK